MLEANLFTDDILLLYSPQECLEVFNQSDIQLDFKIWRIARMFNKIFQTNHATLILGFNEKFNELDNEINNIMRKITYE